MALCALLLLPAVGRVCGGPGFGCAPPLLGEVLGCVCACVPVLRGLRHLLVGGAVRGCVVGPGLLPRPATPGWGVRACVCLCVRPACTPLFLGGVCCVGVCAGLGFRLRPVPLGWVVGVCVRSCVCPACPRPSSGAACGAGMCGCCRCWGLPPPPPLVFFWGGGFVVSVAGCPGLGSRGLCPPIPSLPGRVVCCLFFFPVLAWCVSACFGCPFSRWAAALGLVLPVLAGWSPGAPLRGPVFRAVWVGGLAASCGVGARCGGCGPFSRPPPCFFFGRGGLAVPPSAFPGLAHALVGILCGFPVCCWWLRFARLCPGPMGRVGYVHVGLGAPSCRVRFLLCRVGGCARRLRVALGLPCPFVSAVPVVWVDRHRCSRACGGPLPVCGGLVRLLPGCAVACFG